MKNFITLTCFTLLSFSITAGAFAQDKKEAPAVNAEAVNLEEDGSWPVLLFSEGPAFSWLTRIKKQSGRSNFVFRDFLLGLYFRMDIQTKQIFSPMIRFAAFYPLKSSFNKFPQKPDTPLHYAMDMNMGVTISIFDFSYFRLNAGPAIHMFFLNSDRWNYFNMGGALFLGMELPMSPGWTVICNGSASFDNGNLGANRVMEPFNIVYQYQVDIGVRYSRKLKNRTSLFPGKKQASEEMPLLTR